MLERIGVYKIEDVLPYAVEDKKSPNAQRSYQGGMVNMFSDRYKTFSTSGTKCVKCGLQGEFFALEKDYKATRYHFNLYGKDADGRDLLFTKDHIVPISKGGRNHVSNYQTMCCKCNCEKANS